MKRVAIILGSPYPQNSRYHLRGVSQDVINYKNYLLSATGGTWREDEIHVGTHIKKSDVKTIQRLCHNADIALIVYSGHGFMKHDGNYLNINPDEALNLVSLDTTAKRQITITDACRTDYPYEHLEGIGGFGFSFDNTLPHLARKIYDYYVEHSPFGRLNIFSSSENEPSLDTENGGLFSVSLFNAVNDWASYTDKYCLTAANAFTLAYNDLSYTRGSQTPTATYTGRIIPTFPFCVNTKVYIQKYGRPASLTQRRNLVRYY